MPTPAPTPRRPEGPVDPMFPDRWSPRAFRPDPLTEDELHSLFEAARWAPSCYNDQPWLFGYAVSAPARARCLEALVPQNRVWARHAPLLAFLAARRAFAHNDRPNRHHAFDAGAAWMALALQARRLGLYAHAMAGFRRAQAYPLLGLDAETHEILAAIAVGRRGDPGLLPDEVAAREVPNDRKPWAQVAREIR